MGARYYLFVLLPFLLPLAHALLVPHATSYELDFLERRDVCLTVYTPEPAELNVSCGGEFVSSQPVPPGAPLTLCFSVLGDRTKTCVVQMGGERAYIYVHVVPRNVLSAVLSVLLVFLIVRFAAKLTRIYTKAR